MSCPTRYVNSVPEHVPVVITNQAISVSVNTDRVTWLVDVFELGDSAADAGLLFFLSKPAVHGSEVQVFQDNVHQEPGESYTVGAGLDRVTLAAALPEGSKLVVRYLAYVDTSPWVTETLRVQDSADEDGLVFTLGQTPDAGSANIHVIQGVALLEYGTDYTVVGAVVTLLGTALAAGETLVVTYLPE